jgi:hypothetical protein
MNKNEFVEKVAEFKRVQAEYKSMMQENAKNIFSEMSKEVFENNPNLQDFSWTQYTPYFNDGDTCEFSVNTDYFYINRSNSDSDYIDVWYVTKPEYHDRIDFKKFGFNNVEEVVKAVSEVKDILDMFDEDDYMEMFGDHAEVTVSRNDGVTVDGYDHD